MPSFSLLSQDTSRFRVCLTGRPSKVHHPPQKNKKVYLAEAEQDDTAEIDQNPADIAGDDVDHDFEAEDQEQWNDNDNQHDDEDGIDNLDDILEVLTVTARRLASVKLGRKYTGGKSNTAELKKKTACAACVAIGHWRGDPECKVSGNAPHSKGSTPDAAASTGKGKKPGHDGKGKAHQAFVVTHSDLWSYEAHSSYGTAFADNQGFQVNVVFTATTVPYSRSLPSYMILDTACQRTCAGRRWMAENNLLLRDYSLETIEVGRHDKFQFGSGEPVISDYRAYIPFSLTPGMHAYLGAGILDATIPLLASNPLLKALGMVLDLPHSRVWFSTLGVTVPVVDLSGHLAVNITAFGHSAADHFGQLFQSACWQNAPPELVLAPTDRAEGPSVHADFVSHEHIPPSEHVSLTSAMVAEMALPAPKPVVVSLPPLHQHDQSRALEDLGQGVVAGGDGPTRWTRPPAATRSSRGTATPPASTPSARDARLDSSGTTTRPPDSYTLPAHLLAHRCCHCPHRATSVLWGILRLLLDRGDQLPRRGQPGLLQGHPPCRLRDEQHGQQTGTTASCPTRRTKRRWTAAPTNGKKSANPGCAEPGMPTRPIACLRQGTANLFEAIADGGHPGALRWRGKAIHDGPRLRPHFLLCNLLILSAGDEDSDHGAVCSTSSTTLGPHRRLSLHVLLHVQREHELLSTTRRTTSYSRC